MNQSTLGTILREPLLHFLLLGVGLFLAFGYVNPDTSATDPRTIVVDRDKLLTYLQYRARAFDGERFDQILNELPEDKLQQVVDDFVKEEALYREAKALQLDQNDYMARRRLIQQLEFITRGFVETEERAVSEKAIQEYFKAHQADYYQAPEITFTHVFFSADQRGQQSAQSEARHVLKQLNENAVPFDRAMAYGDRFLYHVNYVNRNPEEIASHFGEGMQQQLFNLNPNVGHWYGPFASPYGYHLVMVTHNAPGYVPELADIRDQVAGDLQRELEDKRFQTALQAIVDGYVVKVELLQGKS